MSDYEDEMDVDAPASKVVFSSDNTGAKGKRSAANLPVEAEDSLPWFSNRSLAYITVANHSIGWRSTDRTRSTMWKGIKIF
jgi:replication factor C subunit 3/5